MAKAPVRRSSKSKTSTSKSRSGKSTASRSSSSSRSKSYSRSPKASTAKKTVRRKSSSKQPWQWNQISNERKLDILGIMLALIGLLTFLSLISAQRSSFTNWWINSISQIAGWGTFVLPIALIIVGIWLVLRNMEQLPLFSAERISGIILLYLNILAWMHFFAKGGWEQAANGQGGGYIGAFFELLLIRTVGQAGTVIVLSAWLLVSMGLTFDVSIPDIFRKLQSAYRKLQENRQLRSAAKIHDDFATSSDGLLSSDNQSINPPPDFEEFQPLSAAEQHSAASENSQKRTERTTPSPQQHTAQPNYQNSNAASSKGDAIHTAISYTGLTGQTVGIT